MNQYEIQYYNNIEFLCGVDEAGRGPIAGPLVVCACILPKFYYNELINDSKKLSEKKRDFLAAEIKKIALDYVIIIVSEKEIDQKNIYQATKEAMKKAVDLLTFKPQKVLTDAMPFENAIAIIKGDALSQSISAASILAKTTRDMIMYTLDKKYPEYLFKKHKGYPTKKHLELISKLPILNIYRKTFAPIKYMEDENETSNC